MLYFATSMRNLLLIFTALLCVYLYLHPKVETQVITKLEKVPVMAAAPLPPVPAATPKLYYHSPLDAPAMPNYANTGAGFYSEDPAHQTDNRVLSTTSPYGNSASAYYGGNPYYSYPNGAGGVSNTVIYNIRPGTSPAAPTSTTRSFVVPPASRNAGTFPIQRVVPSSQTSARPGTGDLSDGMQNR